MIQDILNLFLIEIYFSAICTLLIATLRFNRLRVNSNRLTLLQSYTHFGPTDTMFDEQQCSPARRRILRQKKSSMKQTIFNSVFSLLSHTLLGAYFFCVRLHHFFSLTHSANAIELTVFLFNFHSSLHFEKQQNQFLFRVRVLIHFDYIFLFHLPFPHILYQFDTKTF